MGITGQFWLSYMDCVWLVLQFQQAVKQNDFLFYAHCLMSMTDLFLFNGQNYTRYLKFLLSSLLTLQTPILVQLCCLREVLSVLLVLLSL